MFFNPALWGTVGLTSVTDTILTANAVSFPIIKLFNKVFKITEFHFVNGCKIVEF